MQNRIDPHDKDVSKRWSHCGHEIWANCMNSSDPDSQEATRLLGKKTIAKLIFEFVAWIKTPEDVSGVASHIESSIADCFAAMLTIQQAIGAACMSIMTKSFEFV